MRHASFALALLALTACVEGLPANGKDAGTSCSAGTSACGAGCVNLALDDTNCGACGTSCAAGEACAGSRCLPQSCGGASCGAEQVCVDAITCRERLCVNVVCPAGQACRAGACEPESCGEVRCPPGAVCVGGVCADVQCAGVQCGAGRTCIAGQCFTLDCAETDCAEGQVCVNAMRCEDRRCVNVRCGAGQTCVEGACRADACGAMPCPPGNTCLNDACTDTRCVGVTCTGAKACREGACVATGACDAGLPDDPLNCGACGNVCPTPVNAPARCVASQCRRGPCAAGFVDLDGEATPGCESRCTGLSCTRPDGGTVTLSAPPVTEQRTGGVSSSPTTTQGNAAHRHVGALGEPPGTAGATSNGSHRHVGGLTGLRK
jgi:hypothetical protein